MLARKRALTDNCRTRCVAVTVAVTHVNATSSIRRQNLCLGMRASVTSGAYAASLGSATVREGQGGDSGMLQVRLARHLRRHDPKVRPRPNQVLLEVQRDARAGRPHVISPDEDFAGSINQERTGGGFIVAPQVQPAADEQASAVRTRRIGLAGSSPFFQRRGNPSATAYHLKIGMAICSRHMPGPWGTPSASLDASSPRQPSRTACDHEGRAGVTRDLTCPG